MNPNKKTLLPRKNGKTTLELKKFLREKYLGSDLHTLQHADKEIPAKPTNQYLIDFGLGNGGECKRCKNDVYYQQKYCDECGQAIDWSEDE